MPKVWKGSRTAKEVHSKHKVPFLNGETYDSLDHYLIACPCCESELTINLYEKLSDPDHIIIKITKAKHKEQPMPKYEIGDRCPYCHKGYLNTGYVFDDQIDYTCSKCGKTVEVKKTGVGKKSLNNFFKSENRV